MQIYTRTRPCKHLLENCHNNCKNVQWLCWAALVYDLPDITQQLRVLYCLIPKNTSVFFLQANFENKDRRGHKNTLSRQWTSRLMRKSRLGNKCTLHNCTKFPLNYTEKAVNKKAVFGNIFRYHWMHRSSIPRACNQVIRWAQIWKEKKDRLSLLSIELGK